MPTAPYGFQEGRSLTTRSPSRSDELSARGRLLVVAVAIVGIGTFFLPLITTVTPIFGQTRWSLFDIAWHISAGELPPSRRAADPVAPYVGLVTTLFPIYGIWLYSATASLLSVDSLRRKLSLVGLAGMLFSVADWHWDKHLYEDVFFGGWAYGKFVLTRHVAFDDLYIAWIGVMGVLTYIAWSAHQDGHPAPDSMQGETSRRKPEPDFLPTEILPPKKDESGRRPPDVRPV